MGKKNQPEIFMFLIFTVLGCLFAFFPVIGIVFNLWWFFSNKKTIESIQNYEVLDTDGIYKHSPEWVVKLVKILPSMVLALSIIWTIFIFGFMIYLNQELNSLNY